MGADSPIRAWIAIGSNLGDRAGFLDHAERAFATDPSITRLVASAVEETRPLGGLDQPAYLNQMLRIDTRATPRALLDLCHRIERTAGRQRTDRWCSRTLDLDLVRYGDVLCDTPDLTLPHPGLRDRLFWAREIAALESHD